MKTYISGQITDQDIKVVEKRFSFAAETLRLLGYTPVNPLNIHAGKNQTWQDYMRADITELVRCEAIYMLKGWHESKGANLEYTIAKELGLVILFE